jgi:choline dehydrogenase
MRTDEYDYIVVGSGAAGSAVAARLSEEAGTSVLLLEAGPPDRHPLQLTPLAFLKVARGSRVAVQYESEPEPHLDGRRLAIPRGRTLGGSSSVNAMIAIRGNPRDYDRWREQGLDGWSYAEVLPYFKRMETSWRGPGPWHGGSGPLKISRMAGPDLLWEPLFEAARAAGVPYCEDANGAGQDGISRMEATVWNGARSSASRAYLYPAMGRRNLTIETSALASRIVIDRGRAVAVEYRQHGRLTSARAGREIVLCGGAYNSPQLLMLSGIGQPDELRALGIEPVHELPGVGRNLHDHPNIMNEYELRGSEGLTRHIRLDRALMSLARWYATGSGPFALTGSTANIFARTVAGLDQPDIQMICLPISNSAEPWTPGLQRKPAFRLAVRTGYLRPKSRGWVKLRSNDPSAPPRIQFNMLAEPDDLAAMLRAIRLSREIYAQSPLKEMIASEVLPGPGTSTDTEMIEHIRRHAGHRSHPVGACRMGLDAEAVVDPQLRVRGVEGLRVADASVMPQIVSGNTNLPCTMIGEKASDLILGRKPPAEA